MNNVILEVEYGNTTQIDHILINEYGVFVIETKNYKGVVYGTEGKNYWKQYLKNKYRVGIIEFLLTGHKYSFDSEGKIQSSIFSLER